MDNLPSMVIKKLKSTAPTSHVKDFIAFEFLTEYKFHLKNVDLVALTNHGEIIEYKHKTIYRSIYLQKKIAKSQLLIHFNNIRSILFYLVLTDEKLYVITTEEIVLSIFKQYSNVKKCEIIQNNASQCENIKVWFENDVLPSTLNENYEVKSDICLAEIDSVDRNKNNAFEIMLQCKLNEAKYNTERNEMIYEKNKSMRSDLCHIIREELMSGHVVKGTNEAVTFKQLWFQIYNQKLVIGVEIKNDSIDFSALHLGFILRSDANRWSYDTQIYCKENPTDLLWEKISDCSMKLKKNCMVIAVTDVPTFENASSIEYKGYLTYMTDAKIKFLNLPKIDIVGLKMVGGSYDVIDKRLGALGPEEILSILATSARQKVDVHFEEPIKHSVLNDLFKRELGFIQAVKEDEDTLIHYSNPFHILHGSFLILQKNPMSDDSRQDYQFDIWARSESQILTLINLLYDLPTPRLSILPSGKLPHVSPIQKKLSESMFDSEMDIDMDKSRVCDNDDLYHRLFEALKLQTDMIITYFDECLKAMVKSRDRTVQKLIGSHIDLLAPGADAFNSFREKIEAEISSGFVTLNEIK